MLKVLSYILPDLDPKVKVIGQKAAPAEKFQNESGSHKLS